MAAEWQPQTEVIEDEWRPSTEKVVVSEHERSPRKKVRVPANVLQSGIRGGLLARGITPEQAGGVVGAIPTVLSTAGMALGGGAGTSLGALAGPGAPVAAPALGYAGGVAGSAAGAGAGKAIENALMPLVAGEVPGEASPDLGAGVGREALIGGGGAAIGIPAAGLVNRAGSILSGKALAQEAAKSEALARASTATFDPKVVAAGIDPLRTKLIRLYGAGSAQVRSLERRVTNFINQHVKGISAADLHEFVRDASRAAERIYRGKGGTPLQEYWKGVADTGRGLLRTAIPGYENQQARVATEIGLRRAIPAVAGRIGGSAAGGAGAAALLPAGSAEERFQHAIAGGVAGGILGTPALSGPFGDLLSSRILQLLLQRSPALVGQAAVPDTLGAP